MESLAHTSHKGTQETLAGAPSCRLELVASNRKLGASYGTLMRAAVERAAALLQYVPWRPGSGGGRPT